MFIPVCHARWATCAVVVVATLAFSSPGWAQDPGSAHKYDEVVGQAIAEGRSVRAIVRFANNDARLRGSQIVAQRGGQVRRALNDVTALTVEVDAATAEALAADQGTLTLSIDAPVRAMAAPGTLKAARSSGARAARQKFNTSGLGVSIAIIDSGVQPHQDLPASRIRAFVDFVNGRSAPYDDFGHGTHVAGVAAGSGAASASLDDPYSGTAPNADIVALKVLDSQGAGRTSDVIAALEWVAQHHATYNIRVVNLSLGHPVYEPAATDPLVRAAEALVARGIVVVASAGNMGIDPVTGLTGFGGVTSPANGSRIIAVGAADNQGTAVRSDDRVTDYSSRGPSRFDLIVKPDMVASGHRVVSLAAPNSFLFANYPDLQVPVGTEPVASYMVLSGTSMAAPLVAGTAALLFEANPGLSAGAVRAVLEFTAQRLPSTTLLAQGAGQVNALGAVRLARLIKPNVPIGHIWLRSPGGVPVAYDMLFGEPVAWAKNVIWGDGVLLGDSAYLRMLAWSDNIVWGQRLDNIVWGQCEGAACHNIVWGQCVGAGCDNIVWGQETDNIVWGQQRLENIVWGQCETAGCDNIVWGQRAENIVWGQLLENIVWGQYFDNIVWGQDGHLLGYWAANTIWAFWDLQVDWTAVTRQNIVWGQGYFDNIVWGQHDNIVWGQYDNIVWGQFDNIVWGQSLDILTMGAVQ